MMVRFGHRSFRIPRLPWLTLTLSLLSIGVFVGLPQRETPVRSDRLDEATAFWLDHAYLEPEPEILLRALAGVELGRRDKHLDDIHHDSYRNWPTHAETRNALQAELAMIRFPRPPTRAGDSCRALLASLLS
jgi:hypothetical protein